MGEARADGALLTAVTTLLTEAAQNEDWQRTRDLVAVHARLADSAEEQREDADFYVLVHPQAGILGARVTRPDAEADLAALKRSGPRWASSVQIQPASLDVNDGGVATVRTDGGIVSRGGRRRSRSPHSRRRCDSE